MGSTVHGIRIGILHVCQQEQKGTLFRHDHAVALKMGKQLPHTQLVFLWHGFVSLDYTPSMFQLQSITVNLKSDRGQEIVRKVSVSCIFLVVM